MADKGPFAGIEVYKAEWSKEGWLVLSMKALDNCCYLYLRHKGNIVRTGGKVWKVMSFSRPTFHFKFNQYLMSVSLKET
jgi:hypothetical protein